MKRIALIMSFILIIIAGCGSSKNLTVELSTPKTFSPGKSFDVLIKVVDMQGNPIKGAKVIANLTMKNMDHGTLPMVAEEIGDGEYIGTVSLSMNGDWVASIRVKHDGGTFEVEKEFSVEVKTVENDHKGIKGNA